MPLFTHFLDFTNTYNIDNIFLYCINQINDIYEMQRGEIFYIGCTNNPNYRTFSHLKKKAMTKMYVLCKLNNKENACTIETHLINVYGSLINNYNMAIKGKPQSGGGQGLSKGPYYIYILFE